MSDISLASLPPEVRADVCRALKIAQADAELVTLRTVEDQFSPTCVICESYNYEIFLDGPITRRLLPMIRTWREARAFCDTFACDSIQHILVAEADARACLFDLEQKKPSKRYLETGILEDARLDNGIFPETQDGRFGKRPRITPKLAAQRAAEGAPGI